MAKKKAPGSNSPGTSSPPTASRTRAPRKGAASSDQSPITGGMPATSEEAQLAVAHDSSFSAGSAQPSYQEIAEAAYQRYLRRGGVDGQDFDDWLAAERELIERHSAKP